MIGILVVTGLSILLGLSQLNGVVSMPPSLAPTFMQLDIMGALDIGLISVIFAFLFVDLFDTSGTLIGVAQKAELLDKDGKMPRLGRALLADSTATMAGAALGTSTTTSYIESAAGTAAGGRTGLTACVVALLFLLSLFFALLAGAVPAYATAPALLFVAVLMMSSLAGIDWDDLTVAAPVAIAALAMPLTFHRQRHRLRLHRLDRHQAAGPLARAEPGDVGALGTVRGQAWLVYRLIRPYTFAAAPTVRPEVGLAAKLLKPLHEALPCRCPSSTPPNMTPNSPRKPPGWRSCWHRSMHRQRKSSIRRASITACVPSSACGAKTASAITRCSSRATSTRRS